MVALEILGYAFLIVLIVLLFIILSILTQYLSLFCWRKCKHCKRIMEYKGRVDNKDGNYYLFYCSKCGKWEKVPCDAIISNS